ncbi:hypothetical protein BX070DRAFT_235320 [Coemansia spiralis]|nr:hypothetical protein BX070DRAFT_235320 [Coemansia spiralis]
MPQNRAGAGLRPHSNHTTHANSCHRGRRLPATSTTAQTNHSVADSRLPSRLLVPKPRKYAWLQYVVVLVFLFIASPVLAAESSLNSIELESSSISDAEFSTSLTNVDVVETDDALSEESVSESADKNNEEGGIGIVGAFSGISSFTPNSNGAALSLDANLTSVVSLSQDAASLLASATTDGDILAACAFYNSDGSIAKAFFGGSFSMLNSTTAGYVAGVDFNGNIDSMLGGVNNMVNALFCDQDTQLVYVGGNFSSTAAGRTTSIATMLSSSTGALATYNASKGVWQDLTFHGLNGPVFDFTKMQNNVYAVGAFSATVDNASYVALDTQPINLSVCTITGGNNAETAGFSDPRNVICTNGADSSGNTWLMRDLLTGFYRIDFPFKTTPSILRLMNTMYEGRGTKTIRIEAAENNQVLQMAYLDPITKAAKICSQTCPILHNYEWQEFWFYDNDETLGNITGITINIAEWYGMGGGFNKIELYERGKYSIVLFSSLYPSSPLFSLYIAKQRLQ